MVRETEGVDKLETLHKFPEKHPLKRECLKISGLSGQEWNLTEGVYDFVLVLFRFYSEQSSVFLSGH